MSDKSVQPPIAGSRPSTKKRRSHKLQRVLDVCVLAVVALVTYCAVARAAYPLFLIRSENREITTMKRQLNSQSKLNKQLKARIIYLKTTEGSQTEARRYGWVKPGEVSYQLTSPDQPIQSPRPQGLGGTVRSWFHRN